MGAGVGQTAHSVRRIKSQESPIINHESQRISSTSTSTSTSTRLFPHSTRHQTTCPALSPRHMTNRPSPIPNRRHPTNPKPKDNQNRRPAKTQNLQPTNPRTPESLQSETCNSGKPRRRRPGPR
ncbi:hypothetical protein FA15DRAFT_673105 [Coprinopsis marcescibilis]|uniref:Uncharacterized protein n=1 Tax=Coprinopsis marcescibilis TaxID=230819 RepID=A0A5C3KLJ1_COPMA|nr:hypothetical protein FA15DRAFT_673105 [Coprinopsis marcescibilis]